jgi:hypothetical protein
LSKDPALAIIDKPATTAGAQHPPAAVRVYHAQLGDLLEELIFPQHATNQLSLQIAIDLFCFAKTHESHLKNTPRADSPIIAQAQQPSKRYECRRQ